MSKSLNLNQAILDPVGNPVPTNIAARDAQGRPVAAAGEDITFAKVAASSIAHSRAQTAEETASRYAVLSKVMQTTGEAEWTDEELNVISGAFETQSVLIRGAWMQLLAAN